MLQGIRVEKRKSPKKNPQRSPGYVSYLKGGKKNNIQKKDSSIDSNKNIQINNKSPTIRIIRSKEKKNSKHKFTRQNTSKGDKYKNILEIEKNMENQKKLRNSWENNISSKNIKNNEKNTIIINHKEKKKPKRSTKKSTKRHVERKRAREISLKPKKVSEKDIKKIEEKIQKIKNTKSKDIRDALEKKGIRVSGKSDRLLKDIYFYSEVGNMNIRHE